MDTKYYISEFETMQFKTFKDLASFPMKFACTYAYSVLNNQNLHFHKGNWILCSKDKKTQFENYYSDKTEKNFSCYSYMNLSTHTSHFWDRCVCQFLDQLILTGYTVLVYTKTHPLLKPMQGMGGVPLIRLRVVEAINSHCKYIFSVKKIYYLMWPFTIHMTSICS